MSSTNNSNIMTAQTVSTVAFDPRPRAQLWAVAEKFGRLRARLHRGKQRFYLDFGRLGKLYSLRGTSFENEHDAERILRAIQGRVAEGVSKALAVEPFLPVDHSSKRVGVLLVKWIEEMEELESKGQRSENTLRDYRRWTKVGGEHAYLLRLANRSIHAIDYITIREWQKSIPLEGKSLKNVTAGLSSFLGRCRRANMIQVTPPIPWPAVDEYLPNMIRPERQDQILMHWPENELGVLLCMMLLGTRHSEAWAVKCSDYRDGFLWMRHARKGRRLESKIRGPKNRLPRVLPVPDALAEWIDNHVEKERLLTAEPLFINQRTGGPWTPSSFRRRWVKACTAAGQPVMNSYEALRHSTATEWLRRGASLREVQDLLGHKTPHMTPRYARLANERLVEIVGRSRGSHVDPAEKGGST